MCPSRPDPAAPAPKRAAKLRLSALSPKTPTAFDIVPDAEALADLRDRLDLSALRKVRLAGEIAPEGRHDWRLAAHLGATVVQPCAVTLEPVTTRIEEEVARRYLAEWHEAQEAEAEMPEDDTAEPLPEVVDLMAVLEEALSLALPAFPRAPGAELEQTRAAPPGAAPLDDAQERENPFAALAALKRQTGED
jgi:uncharacterized metal-binding protein YceD (DUF177 family)